MWVVSRGLFFSQLASGLLWIVWTTTAPYATIWRLVWTQALCSLLSLAHGNKFRPRLTTQFFFPNDNHFQTVGGEVFGFFFFVSGSFKLWSSSKTDLQGGVWRIWNKFVSSGLLATAVFMDLTLYLSDSALSNALPGKITQNKPGASALSLCAGLSLRSHSHITLLIQCSPSLPQSCLFLWHLLLVSLSSCFHFVFFVGPRKLKLCVFVDQTSAAS